MFEMNSKGQTAMLELLIGSLLVLVVIIAVLNSFESSFKGAESQGQFAELRQESERSLQRLIRVTGLTVTQEKDWENSETIDEVEELGLARNPLVLSEEKIRRFVFFADFDIDNPESQENYQKSKEKIGLGKYDFSFSVLVRENGVTHPVKDSETGEAFLEIGKTLDEVQPRGGGLSSIVLERAVVLDSGSFQRGTENVNINYDSIIVRLRVYARQ